MPIGFDSRAAELLSPVRAHVDRGLSLLPAFESFEVTVGPAPGFSRMHGHILVLSEELEGPYMHHPLEDGPLPPMDRWRRAACEVLETAALRSISTAVGLPIGTDWRWVGLATDMIDHVVPELECGLEGLALALVTGAPGHHPRAGSAVMRALRAAGQDPWMRIRHVIDGGVISPAEWLQLGMWVFAPNGGQADLPIVVERVGPLDIPCAIDGWRWQPLSVPAHPRGGRIDVEGPGAVAAPWAVSDTAHATMAVATEGVAEFRPHCGGPVGSWVVTSAEGFGQVMGARGVGFRFSASGTMLLSFADAFVGPLAAVKMAEEVGTSGVAPGIWSVAGPFRLAFSDIDNRGLTQHGRGRDAYRVPARGFGISAWLKALEEGTWAWQVTGDRLVLRGEMLGGSVDVRLRRE